MRAYNHGGYLGQYNIDYRINPAADATYTKKMLQSKDTIVFHQNDPNHSHTKGAKHVYVFSNYSNHPVTIDGITYPTSEHYYQMQKLKTIDINDPDFKRILAMTADECRDAFKVVKDKKGNLSGNGVKLLNDGKMHGYSHVRDNQEQWMEDAVRAKFTQHPDALKTLLITGDKTLVEVAHYDKTWGCGKNGKGQNKLGKVLETIRAEKFQELGIQPKDFGTYYNNEAAVDQLVQQHNVLHSTSKNPVVKAPTADKKPDTKASSAPLTFNEIQRITQKLDSPSRYTTTNGLTYGRSGKTGGFYIEGKYSDGSLAGVHIDKKGTVTEGTPGKPETYKEAKPSAWLDWAKKQPELCEGMRNPDARIKATAPKIEPPKPSPPKKPERPPVVVADTVKKPVIKNVSNNTFTLDELKDFSATLKSGFHCQVELDGNKHSVQKHENGLLIISEPYKKGTKKPQTQCVAIGLDGTIYEGTEQEAKNGTAQQVAGNNLLDKFMNKQEVIKELKEAAYQENVRGTIKSNSYWYNENNVNELLTTQLRQDGQDVINLGRWDAKTQFGLALPAAISNKEKRDGLNANTIPSIATEVTSIKDRVVLTDYLKNGASDLANPLKELKNSYPDNVPDRVLIPIRIDGNHVVSLMLKPDPNNPQKVDVFYSDSMGPDHSIAARNAIFDAIHDVFPQGKTLHNLKTTQKDASACGPLTVETLRRWSTANDKELFDPKNIPEQDDVIELRKKDRQLYDDIPTIQRSVNALNSYFHNTAFNQETMSSDPWSLITELQNQNIDTSDISKKIKETTVAFADFKDSLSDDEKSRMPGDIQYSGSNILHIKTKVGFLSGNSEDKRQQARKDVLELKEMFTDMYKDSGYSNDAIDRRLEGTKHSFAALGTMLDQHYATYQRDPDAYMAHAPEQKNPDKVEKAETVKDKTPSPLTFNELKTEFQTIPVGQEYITADGAITYGISVKKGKFLWIDGTDKDQQPIHVIVKKDGEVMESKTKNINDFHKVEHSEWLDSVMAHPEFSRAIRNPTARIEAKWTEDGIYKPKSAPEKKKVTFVDQKPSDHGKKQKKKNDTSDLSTLFDETDFDLSDFLLDGGLHDTSLSDITSSTKKNPTLQHTPSFPADPQLPTPFSRTIGSTQTGNQGKTGEALEDSPKVILLEHLLSNRNVTAKMVNEAQVEALISSNTKDIPENQLIPIPKKEKEVVVDHLFTDITQNAPAFIIKDQSPGRIVYADPDDPQNANKNITYQWNGSAWEIEAGNNASALIPNKEEYQLIDIQKGKIQSFGAEGKNFSAEQTRATSVNKPVEGNFSRRFATQSGKSNESQQL